MIEVILGLAGLLAAAAAAIGLLQPHVPFPVGLETAGAAAFLASLLVAHGLYRLRLKRRLAEDRHWLRHVGLMWTMLTLVAVLAVAAPLAAPLLNAVRVAGFPLGYYMVAQASLIALVIALFVFAARADVIDSQEGAEEE